MPERKPAAIVEDILLCIEHIQSYTTGLSFEQFSSHFMTVEACLYNIQIIGEAVSLLPQDIKKENPGIKWALLPRRVSVGTRSVIEKILPIKLKSPN